jgi:hypothetical protein
MLPPPGVREECLPRLQKPVEASWQVQLERRQLPLRLAKLAAVQREASDSCQDLQVLPGLLQLLDHSSFYFPI